MSITASMVKELRESTGAGMMDAKKALTETSGDFEAAVDWLRTKGLAKAAKKSDRVAAEGLVAVFVDGPNGVAIEVNSETDFVAKNAEFQEMVKGFAGVALNCDSLEALINADFQGKKISEVITDKIATIGENLSLRHGAIWPFLIKDFLLDGEWRHAHLFIALVCSIIIPILFLLIGNKKPFLNKKIDQIAPKLNVNSSLKLSISNKNIQILLMFAGVFCCVAMSMPQVHIVPLCIDNGFGLAVGTEILSYMLFAAVMSRVIFGYLSDKLGPIQTLILCSTLQAVSLSLFLPFDSQMSLYIVAIFFGLSQGGIVPIYAVIISKFLPANEVAERVGLLIFATIIGMSLGGWLSGEIYDYTNSYRLAFLNGIFWNIINLGIMIYLYLLYKQSLKKLVIE